MSFAYLMTNNLIWNEALMPSSQSLVSILNCLSIRLIFATHLLFFSNILSFVLVFKLFLVNIPYGFRSAFYLILNLLWLASAFKGLLNLLGNKLMSLMDLKRRWLCLGLKYFHLALSLRFLLNSSCLSMRILCDGFEFFKAYMIV